MPRLDPQEWEWVFLALFTAAALALVAWWGLLEWLDRRAASRPTPRSARHSFEAMEKSTRRIRAEHPELAATS